MLCNAYEYSFRTASQCGDTEDERRYFDWFLKQSVSRVSRAAIALSRLAEGRDEFDASTIGTFRAHFATINLIEQGLLALRDQSWNVPNRVEDIQGIMGTIAVDVDKAQESYGKLTKVFGGAL